MVDSLESGTLKVIENKAHPLVGLQELHSTFSSIPSWFERGEDSGNLAEIDTVITLVRPRILGKLDATAGHRILYDLRQFTDLIVLFIYTYIERLVVYQFPGRLYCCNECPGDILNMNDGPPRRPVALYVDETR